MAGDDVIQEIHSRNSSFTVTGLVMQYMVVCERETWFYLHGITGDQKNPHIVTGRKIDENSYGDSETRIIDGIISPDILEDGRLLEVKKSSKSEEGARSQLLYYMWYFERFKDDPREGVIAIPEERKRESVSLGDDEREIVKDRIQRAWELWNDDEPPEFEKKPVCKSCAYQDFCWQ